RSAGEREPATTATVSPEAGRVTEEKGEPGMTEVHVPSHIAGSSPAVATAAVAQRRQESRRAAIHAPAATAAMSQANIERRCGLTRRSNGTCRANDQRVGTVVEPTTRIPGVHSRAASAVAARA